MALFGGHRIDGLATEIAHFGAGEAAKVDRCVRIGELAIITGWTTARPDLRIRGTIYSQQYSRPDVEREVGPAGRGFVKACHLPSASDSLEVEIRVGRKRYRSRLAISDDPQTIQTLGAEQQAVLPELGAILSQMLPESGNAFAAAFGEQWPDARDQPDARAPWGSAVAASVGPQPPASQPGSAAAIDEIIAVGSHGYLVVGWCISETSARTALRLCFGPTHCVDLLDGAYRVRRPDLLEAVGPAIQERAGRAGFLRYISAPAGAPSAPLTARLEVETQTLSMPALPEPKRFDDALVATQELLKHLHPGGQSMLALLEAQLGPAIEQLPFPRSDGVEVQTTQFGEPPAHPLVSVIVPLYGRYDFVEYQLSQFANDPDFESQIDLIFVLDDPSLLDTALDCCAAVAPIYEVPFRCLSYPEHLGFAGANNVGLRAARAEHLILINSDVLPSQPGWVSALRARFQSLPDCGVLGTRLLYPDGSIQHDGMAFKQLPSRAGLWINDHPGKGLPAIPVDAAQATAPAPAVTAACIMLRRADALAIGGLDEGYLLGDFEDSDLCLSLNAQGKRTYIARDILLYHLERQSQSLFEDLSWRDKVTIYNGWRHHRKWQSVIAQLSAAASS